MTIGNVRAPFLDFKSFVAEEGERQEPQASVNASFRSPFLSVYELGESGVIYEEPIREAYVTLIDELHDEEFDEALFELEIHGRALHDEHMGAGSSRIEADRLVTQHFNELVRESEAMIDNMARQFGSRDEAAIVDHEFDAFAEQYSPSTPLDPEFDDFLGKFIKKATRGIKKVVGKAWQGIKKLGIGPILARIKVSLCRVSGHKV